MKKDEMISAINSALQKEDGGLSEMPSIIEKISADYDTRDLLQEKISELENKVSELRDSNLKLYLAQTGTAEEDPGEELDGMDAVDAFWDNLLKED